MKDSHATLFNSAWKFLLGDPKDAHQETYADSTWKHVDLPHDWVIGQPFKRGGEKGWNEQNMQGFFAWEGVAWYRKEFSLPDMRGNKALVYFGGAYRNSTVYVNGKKAGGRAYGYSSFELDISEFVKEGKNLIAVRLDNSCEPPDRWYSGSGLYRNIYLKILPQAHIKTWGVHIKTLLADSKQADIAVETSIANSGTSGVSVHAKVLRPDGTVVAEVSTPFSLTGSEISVRQRMKIQNPALWSDENPSLYLVRINLAIDGKAEKPLEIPFGIRKIKFVNHEGMLVNEQPVKLKGVCLHHDCGITGSAHYDDVWRRRLVNLKNIGCNAIRTSHNPPAEEFLDLCDELGFYVIDECFDKWKSGYYSAHFKTDAERDLEDMILRDRNHPSVIMWSIGNEVEDQGSIFMLRIQKKLADLAHTLDSRPVTCALAPHVNPPNLPAGEQVKITKKLAQDIDVLGLNYHEPLYQDYIAAIDKLIIGTECYEYYTGTAENYEDITTKNPWQFVRENNNVIGQFIWAGIDYLGESSWPSKGWTGAILDISGGMKPNAYFRKSIWTDEPMIYIGFYDQNAKQNYARDRWSFPPLSSHLNLDHFNCRTVTAVIYTNCDEAELWINNKRRGRRKTSDFANGIIEWNFGYEFPSKEGSPFKEGVGELKIVGYRKGKEMCSHVLKTAGVPQQILLEPDRTSLNRGFGGGSADGGVIRGCVAHVEVSICDKNKILCPHEELLVEFSLSGDGEILGACSADLNSGLGFTLPKTFTSGGKALVLIKAGASPGALELTAYCENLKSATVKFKVK
jgi:beta-galactosidase